MRVQRSYNFAWVVAVLIIGVLVVLSPAYLHFTRSGPELVNTPEAPNHPQSDAACDKLYATYASQIGNLQAEIGRDNALIEKTQDATEIAKHRAEIAKASAQSSELSTMGMEARDDCYVKVANYQTEQKSAEARKYAANGAAPPQAYAARPEAAPEPALAMAAVSQPASTPAPPPVRAYVYGHGQTGPAVQTAQATTSESAATAPRPHVARHARSSGHAYAWAAHKARRHHVSRDEPAVEVAAAYPSEPRLEVASYDRVLVASADGVVRLPEVGTSDVQVASAADTDVAPAKTSVHHRGRLHHLARLSGRRHAAHRTLVSAQSSPTMSATSAVTTTDTTAGASLIGGIQPISTTVGGPFVPSDTTKPALAARTTSGTDPPGTDGSKPSAH
jgi:hypothetical protein